MSSSRGGIVTIQLGELSNRLGATLWCVEEQLRQLDMQQGRPTVDHTVLWHTVQRDRKDAVSSALSRRDADETKFDHSHDHRPAGNASTSDTTYMPRLVSCAVKDTVADFTTVSCTGQTLKALQYRSAPPSLASIDLSENWSGSATQVRQPQRQSSGATSQQPQTWHDKVDITLHPEHTFYDLSIQSTIDSSISSSDFQSVAQGLVTTSSNASLHTALEEIADHVRYWVEQCDRLTGFHVIVDVDSGFAGIALSVIQQLIDDYGADVPIFTFGLLPFAEANPSLHNKARIRQLLNTAIATQLFTEHCKLYIPLDLAHIMQHLPATLPPNTTRQDMTLQYLATAVHQFTLPYRLVQAKAPHMIDYAHHFTSRAPGCNLVGMSYALPLNTTSNPFFGTSSAINALRNLTGELCHHDDRERNRDPSSVSYAPLWHPDQPAMQPISPFSTEIPEAKQLAARRKVNTHIDVDDDYDIDEDEHKQPGRPLHGANPMELQDDLVAEWVVLGGVTDWKQQMQFTNNYEQLTPYTSQRQITYSELPTVDVMCSTADSIEYCSALLDTYSSRHLIGHYLRQLTSAVSAVLGDQARKRDSSMMDSNEARAVLNHYQQNGMPKEEIRTQVLGSLQTLCDAYLNV